MNKIRTPREARGYQAIKRRPATLGDMKRLYIPPKTIRNVKSGHIVKGIRDIMRIGWEPYEKEISRMLRMVDQQRINQASSFHNALDKANALSNRLEKSAKELQATNEEMETANEELQATNEEMEATNEELQATNEEMEATNEELMATSEELERTNTELQQFAYVVSHDLKEPLRTTDDQLKKLERRYRGRMKPDAHGLIKQAKGGISQMRVMIDGLLNYASVGTQHDDLEPTDSGAALKAALANLEAAIRESGAKVRHDHLPAVTGDRLELTQLFQNLLANAIKFKRKTPLILISAEKVGKRNKIKIPPPKIKKGWVFSVHDNGIGIAPEDRDRIFRIFERLQPGDKYSGAGIGLATCKKIIDRYGGRIWVESEPDKGSTFYFTIPE